MLTAELCPGLSNWTLQAQASHGEKNRLDSLTGPMRG